MNAFFRAPAVLPSFAPAALLALASCAGPSSSPSGGGPLAERAVQLPGQSPNAVYSNGVFAGNTLYLSGKLGVDPETGQVPPRVEDEIRLCLDGLADVLAAAGMDMNDLVSVTVFCTDTSLYDTFNGIYATYFDGAYPARAFIGSGPLLRGAHFEVTGIAYRQRLPSGAHASRRGSSGNTFAGTTRPRVRR